jgi:hypothetical protein
MPVKCRETFLIHAPVRMGEPGIFKLHRYWICVIARLKRQLLEQLIETYTHVGVTSVSGNTRMLISRLLSDQQAYIDVALKQMSPQ